MTHRKTVTIVLALALLNLAALSGCSSEQSGRRVDASALDGAADGPAARDSQPDGDAGAAGDAADLGTVDARPGPARGLDRSGYERGTPQKYKISPYTAIGAWDSTGTIASISAQVHQNLESDPDHPRSIYIPAGMVVILGR